MMKELMYKDRSDQSVPSSKNWKPMKPFNIRIQKRPDFNPM